MEEAMDALGSDLSIRLSRREEIPKPSRVLRGSRQEPVPLWLAMRDQHVSKSDLAPRAPSRWRMKSPPRVKEITAAQRL